VSAQRVSNPEHSFGSRHFASQVLSNEFIVDIVTEGLRSSNESTNEIAQWTKEKLERITGQQCVTLTLFATNPKQTCGM
jgi:hypothetical protein